MYSDRFTRPAPKAQEPEDISDYISIIQTDLRQLSYHDDDIYSVAIDGVWGEETANSTKSLPRKYGLPVTGVVDLQTWELLREKAAESRRAHSPTEPIRVFPRYPSDYFWDRESSPIQIQILQYVLRELSTEYPDFSDVNLSGIYDEPTADAIYKFQQKNGLTPTGKVDRTTWNSLAEQYNKIADVSNR